MKIFFRNSKSYKVNEDAFQNADSLFQKFGKKANGITSKNTYSAMKEILYDGGIQGTTNLLETLIGEFNFDYEIVKKWKISKFVDKVQFLIYCTSVNWIEKYSIDPHQIFSKFAYEDIEKIRSYFYAHTVSEYIQIRPSVHKPSDFRDFQYLYMLPFMKYYICDNEILSAIKMINRKSNIPLDTNTMGLSTFKELLDTYK